jgi:hypothetical protein
MPRSIDLSHAVPHLNRMAAAYDLRHPCFLKNAKISVF